MVDRIAFTVELLARAMVLIDKGTEAADTEPRSAPDVARITRNSNRVFVHGD
ncbi:hypothetical protein [Haliangium sp.]|uniref:hypothetical protein n=1 Tax=Haliangium sp. TaxID=2663208 RepID=UPI003D149E67